MMHLLYRRAVMTCGRAEVKLTSDACTHGLSFVFGPVDLLVKVLAGTQRVVPARGEERSSDREVDRPCGGRGAASGGIRADFEFVCRQQTKGERRKVGIICGIKEKLISVYR
jgi:hypothetical protein